MKIEQRSTDTSPLEAQRQVFPAPNQKLVRITPDRANAFSEAVQAATPHTTLILAPGRYVEEREVVISQQGLIVVSESKHAAKIFVASSLDRPFLCIEAADVVLVGIAIEDHRAAALDHQHVCVAIEPASNARIEGCEISAKFGTAIEAKGGSMPAVRDCIIHACIRCLILSPLCLPLPVPPDQLLPIAASLLPPRLPPPDHLLSDAFSLRRRPLDPHSFPPHPCA
eukprot:1112650-Rhodomonas_salina.1